jgi:predicted nucleic acid-binding protein
VKAEPRFVLDSFAVLAYIQKEASELFVGEVLDQAARQQAEVLLCLVNLGEAAYITERKKGRTRVLAMLGLIDELPIAHIEADRALTLAAAHIKARYPLSYADAFAAALAEREKATLLTGDAEFRHVEHLISVNWLPTR